MAHDISCTVRSSLHHKLKVIIALHDCSAVIVTWTERHHLQDQAGLLLP